MNKKLLAISSLLILGAVVTTSVVVLNNSSNHKIDSAGQIYTLTLDKDHRIYDVIEGETVSTAKVRTDHGTDIPIEIPRNASIDTDDYFLVLTSTEQDQHQFLEFKAPLNGLIKMEYTVDFNLEIDAGYEVGNYPLQDILFIPEEKSGTFDFMDHILIKDYGIPPCSLKLETPSVLSLDYKIKSLKLYYTCEAAGDPTKSLGSWTTEANDDTANSITITGFDLGSDPIPEDRTLVVPAKIDGAEVTRIKEGTLDNDAWIEHIVLPFVGNSKFLNMGEDYVYNFATIFGKNSAHIRYEPIQQYDGTTFRMYFIPKPLTKVTVYGSSYSSKDDLDITYLPSYAFYGCGTLVNEFNIIGSANRIGSYAFANCTAVKNLLFKEDTTTLGEGAFLGCNSLYLRFVNANINFGTGNPDSRGVSTGFVRSIEQDGVYYDYCLDTSHNAYLQVVGCVNNTYHIDIPNRITIGGNEVTVKKIASRAFQEMFTLRTVIFRDEMENVGKFAFKDCYHATIFVRGSGITLEEDWDRGAGKVFYGYTNEWGTRDGCTYYRTSVGNVVTDTDGTKQSYLNFLLFQDPPTNPYVYFGAYAFEGNTTLTEIRLPSSFVLANYAFYDCINLDEVWYEGTETSWNTMMALEERGTNIFLNTKVTSIHVKDNQGTWIEIPFEG